MEKLTEFKDVRFVPTFPLTLEFGVLYVSREHSMVECACPCGCGSVCNMALQPMWPKGWTMQEQDGKVTLNPSVLNTLCPDKAHFFIRGNKICWV